MPEGVGYSNPQAIAVVGQDITYIAGKYWGGWSGDVICTNGADGTLFNFRSPKNAVIMRFTMIVDRSYLGTNEIGYDLKLNGQSVANYRMPNTNNTQDLDALVILVPPLTEVLIESQTDDDNNITTNGVIVAEII